MRRTIKFPRYPDSTRAEDTFLEFGPFGGFGIDSFESRETGFFTYLSPDREGPRDLQQIQSVPTNHLQLGPRGEFAAEVLHANERKIVRKELLHPETRRAKSVNHRLRHQFGNVD